MPLAGSIGRTLLLAPIRGRSPLSFDRRASLCSPDNSSLRIHTDLWIGTSASALGSFARQDVSRLAKDPTPERRSPRSRAPLTQVQTITNDRELLRVSIGREQFAACLGTRDEPSRQAREKAMGTSCFACELSARFRRSDRQGTRTSPLCLCNVDDFAHDDY
jgi:hypothetical protein